MAISDIREKLQMLGWIFLGALFISGVLTLCILLRYVATMIPSIYIEQFDVIAPNQTAIFSTNATSTIAYTFKFSTFTTNNKVIVGTYYDVVNLTFYYKNPNNLSFVPMGNSHIDPFYGSGILSTYRRGQVQPSGVVWGNSSNIAAMVFRVELKTMVKQLGTRKRKVRVRAQVQVNDQGKLTKKNRHKELDYYSMAPKMIKISSSARYWVIILGFFIAFCL